ncbi:MAG: retroviral-like aspartic protease family protein [Methylotetracoccus sp.]|nr:retroviral-like aspartic protease family protein [Methylotetracoccus sp.]
MQANHDTKKGRFSSSARSAGPSGYRRQATPERSGLRQRVARYRHWIFALLLVILGARLVAQRLVTALPSPVATSGETMAGDSAPAYPDTRQVENGLQPHAALNDELEGPAAASGAEARIEERGDESGPETISLIIEPGPNGGYYLRGTINQQEVVFIVDTGASWIVVPEQLRHRLKLTRGRYVQVTTASGVVGNYATVIDSLALGPLQFEKVEGVLNPRAPNEVVLLGMSALKDVRIEQSEGRLTLTQRRAPVSDAQAIPSSALRAAPSPRRPLRECSAPGQVIDRRTLECMEGR